VTVEISLVVPTYKCEGCLEALHARASETFRQLGVSYELIFVDDRSPDDSWRVLRRLADGDRHVRLLRLSRNFGQHTAITAGLSESSGRFVVVMDCDLQNRPEDIAALYRKALEGYDIVYTRRQARSQPLLRRLTARAYYRLRRMLTSIDMDPEHGSMALASRKAIDAFLRVRDRDRQYLLILYWLGFDWTTVEVAHEERYAGRSSYTLAGLLRVALDGIFFQTTKLLRYFVYAGFLVALSGVVLAGYLTYFAFAENPYPGWTSLAVLILLVGGFIMVTTGVAGLYVGKIFDQVKDRPLWVLDERVEGGAAEDGEPAAERRPLGDRADV
jgi:dolichol-phosphate mannosyltransferase